jgi:hypothetical protein
MTKPEIHHLRGGGVMSKEELVPSKVNVTWPVTIFTKGGSIKAKSKAVTDEGLFVHCEKKLPQNEICKIVIKPAAALSVVVRGKFTYSNLSRTDYGNTSSIRGLSFAKISDENRYILKDLRSLIKGKGMESVRKVSMKLRLETDKKTVVRGFDNLNDLRRFMRNFFSLPEIVDRRTEMSSLRYTGSERRMQI